MPKDEHLRDALRAEADKHHPDRTAMLNRIAARRASPPDRRPMARIVPALSRPAAAATAVATMLVVGVAGAQVINRNAEPGEPPAAGPTSVAASPHPSAPPATPSVTPRTSRPPTATTAPVPPAATGKPRTTAPRPAGRSRPPAVRDGYLSATAVLDPASFENWAQGNLTLRTTEPINELDVTIRIARTEGVANTGLWTSIPAEMMTSSVEQNDKELVYRFILRRDVKKGQTLAPGTYVFAAQYNHAAGKRDPAKDSYKARTDSTKDRDAQVTGSFTG